MENMVDALKIAFAVIVFVMALTIAFTVFPQAKATSEFIFYLTDKTNFEEHLEESKTQAKIVGLETILPLVARYIDYNENYSIEIKKENGENIVTFDIREDADANRTYIQAKKRLEEEMEKLVKNYQNRKFIETYSEEVYKGEIYTTENGETFEAVNTYTRIRVTYQLIN